MPATRHKFTDNPLPGIVVADSSFIFHALIDDGQGRHVPARDFAQRIRTANSLLIYSSLLFLEAPQCWRRLYRRGLLTPTTKGIDLATDRMNAFDEANQKLDLFLSGFRRNQILITRSLMGKASAFAANYDLNSHDALIVAMLRELGVANLAAFDKDFRVVDPLELWDGLLIP